MLAGERAARVDARLENRLREPPRPLGLALDAPVVEHERVEVAVAGVEDVADAQPVLRLELAIRRSTSGSFVRGTTPSWT